MSRESEMYSTSLLVIWRMDAENCDQTTSQCSDYIEPTSMLMNRQSEYT